MLRALTPVNRRFQLLLRRSSSGCWHSGDRLVLQDADHDAAVLCLAFHSLVSAHLLAFAHRSGGKHSGKRNLALLKQNVGRRSARAPG